MLEGFMTVPAMVKVGFSFLGILLANRAGLHLGYSILLFSALLSLWAGTGLRGFALQVADLARPENYLLTTIVLMLLFFTEALSKSGRMEKTITALKDWLRSRRLLLAGLPALIGLLPMPGGALFSAPLVASVDSENELEEDHKVAINYWFRHIWEYWWPLYPGVILAIRYSGLPVAAYFLVQIPFTIIAVLGGYLFILKKVERRHGEGSRNGSLDPAGALSAMGPIALLVTLSVLGSALLPLAGIGGTLASLLAMLIGLIAALIWIFTVDPRSFGPSLVLFRDRNTWLMMILVIGIQLFSSVIKYPLDAAGATLVTLMRDELIGAGIPLLTVIMVIPFIAGLVTGVAFGFVGASFPIVFALIGNEPGTGTLAAATACAYSFGYMGMMLSPMHVCFVVTGEYFRCSIYGAYRYLAGPVIMVLIAALLISSFYYLVL
jgi:integral membrane protein (TIGR00529 family)